VEIRQEVGGMATGRVLQFDQARGFGFITAEDGGDDVFLHASVFDGDPGDLVPGAMVSFQIMAGDRGRKAFAVRLADGAAAAEDQPPPPVSQSLPPVQSLSPAEEEQMCDVLSQAEFTTELTEVLLASVPTLTAQQILQTRQGLLDFARKRGWVDA
jgi:cold shock CspA family protein